MRPSATARNNARSGQLVGSWMRMRAMCSITRAPILIRRSRSVANSQRASGFVCGIAERTQCISQNAAVWSASRTWLAVALFMPASSDFKGLPLQTPLKARSEPKGLFPAVTNSPRSTPGVPAGARGTAGGPALCPIRGPAPGTAMGAWARVVLGSVVCGGPTVGCPGRASGSRTHRSAHARCCRPSLRPRLLLRKTTPRSIERSFFGVGRGHHLSPPPAAMH
jgi:hypothetical protein